MLLSNIYSTTQYNKASFYSIAHLLNSTLKTENFYWNLILIVSEEK